MALKTKEDRKCVKCKETKNFREFAPTDKGNISRTCMKCKIKELEKKMFLAA